MHKSALQSLAVDPDAMVCVDSLLQLCEVGALWSSKGHHHQLYSIWRAEICLKTATVHGQSLEKCAGEYGVSHSGSSPLNCRFTCISRSLTVAWDLCTVFCVLCPLSPSLVQFKTNPPLSLLRIQTSHCPHLLSMCTQHLSSSVNTPHLSLSRLYPPIISAISMLAKLPHASSPYPCSWSLLGSNSIAQVGFTLARNPPATASGELQYQCEPPCLASLQSLSNLVHLWYPYYGLPIVHASGQS